LLVFGKCVELAF